MLKCPLIFLVCLLGLHPLAHADFVAHGFFGANPGASLPAHVVVLELPDGLVLPNPLVFEDFERATEFNLASVGWTEQNYTDTVTAGANPNSAGSDTYKGWVVMTRTRLESVFGGRRLNVAPGQVVNGQPVSQLLSGNLLYAESDLRSGNQVQFLYSPIYDCTGQRNLVLAFHSAYEQNQDSVAGVEYTVDRGLSWHPILYMIDRDDIIRGANASIDAVATLNAQYADVAVYTNPANGSQVGHSYGAFLAAPVSAALAPYISGRINDDAVESKRVEAFRISMADEQPNVQFRLFQAGTASWYWAIDDWGIYSIPPNQQISKTLLDQASGTATPVSAVLSVSGRNLSAFGSAPSAPARAPASGTDAATLLNIDLSAAAATALPADVMHTLRVNGLDPAKRYELILYSDLGRGDGSTGARLSYTLTGADAFENLSSSHSTLASVSGAQRETTTIDITDNSATGRGLVCRYNRIRAGTDGSVTVNLQSAQPASLNAFKLIETTIAAVSVSDRPTVTENSAILHGEIASDTPVQVYVCWGLSSGGEQTNTWEHVELLGSLTAGPFSASLQNLETFREYHYAFRSSGAEGEFWSAASSFRPQTEGMIYQTGFEPNEPEPFLPGALQGQGRPGLWRVNQGDASVQGQTMSRGVQAVQAGECTLQVSLTNSADVVWVDAFFRESGTTNQPLVPTNVASSVVFFSADQGLLALDGDGHGAGSFVSVMPNYAKDRFIRLTIRTDYTAKRYDVWVDGARSRANLGFKDNAVQKFTGAQRRSQFANYMDDFSVSRWGLDADSDGDGLVDLDEAKFYGSYPLLADSDGDGVWDGQEVLAHTDPADAQSLFALAISSDNQGHKLIRIPTISGLEYTLQRRGGLEGGQWEDVPGATGITGNGQPKVFLETSDGVNYFYRGVIQNR